jgi:hypothetical protein
MDINNAFASLLNNNHIKNVYNKHNKEEFYQGTTDPLENLKSTIISNNKSFDKSISKNTENITTNMGNIYTNKGMIATNTNNIKHLFEAMLGERPDDKIIFATKEEVEKNKQLSSEIVANIRNKHSDDVAILKQKFDNYATWDGLQRIVDENKDLNDTTFIKKSYLNEVEDKLQTLKNLDTRKFVNIETKMNTISDNMRFNDSGIKTLTYILFAIVSLIIIAIIFIFWKLRKRK